MKKGRKKAGHDDLKEQVHGEHGAGGETHDTPGGIDAVRALQLITIAFLLILLVGFFFHTVLKMI
ncbi:hypothetical protein [Methanoregula sp.]|uniref:hypothetical protein n=1 Tax=Methanoregula sp. TaxID=2052170 RepID=UPI00260FC0EE|nr:hypothetical protein [Methanoregula sp.]MDD5142674.1 hypothetical protein [Methanoregula sp.]